jgi:hypothetical protein
MAMSLTGSPQITAAALDAAINAELAANWFPRVGVVNASNAAAGEVGEFISATVLQGATVALSNNAATNITSISLTPGDWDVSGNVALNPGGGTVVTQFVGWLSTLSATLPTPPQSGGESGWAGSASGLPLLLGLGPMRVNISITTTVYLECLAVWATTQPGGYGFIRARRMR